MGYYVANHALDIGEESFKIGAIVPKAEELSTIQALLNVEYLIYVDEELPVEGGSPQLKKAAASKRK